MSDQINDTSDDQKKYFEFLNKMNNIIISNKNSYSSAVEIFTSDDIKQSLKNRSSSASQKKLRKISQILYYASGQYQKAVNYFALLHTMDYIIEPLTTDITSINPKKYKKEYEEFTKTIEKMNISTAFNEARLTSYIDGAFYGFARPTKNGFYIQKLDPDYCRISFVNPENGLLGYSFDFSYFDKNPTKIESFPEEFRKLYSNSIGQTNKWVQIESSLAICLTTSYDYNPIPALSNVFEGVLDIAKYKNLSKTKEEIDNWVLITQKIPMGGKAQNDFMLSPEFFNHHHDNLQAAAPENAGVTTSPMDINVVKFERDTYDKNKVGQATVQFWDETGASSLLFGTNANTSTALKYSIGTDESDAFRLTQLIELWCNTYIQSVSNFKYGFNLTILPSTKLNRNELIENALKLANAGFPVKNEIMALRGYKSNSALMNSFLENTILKLPDVLTPLSSAHTLSSTESEGRPAKDEGDLTEKGLETKDNESNDDA